MKLAGRWKVAVKSVNKGRYEALLKEDPDNVEALGNLGLFHYRQKEYAKCEECLGKALETTGKSPPNNVGRMWNVGFAHYIESRDQVWVYDTLLVREEMF